MDKEEILKYLKDNKEQLYKQYNITNIGLFGSYARGEYSDSSDIDIVYSTIENKKITYFQLFELIQILESRFKKKVDLVNSRNMEPIIKQYAQKEIIYV